MTDSQPPPHLKERARVLNKQYFSESEGRYVLYWMRTAMRLEENPALDYARLVAANRDLPLVVYQGLSQRYGYASDRHHTFVLEGVQDLQQRAEDLGLRYVFHLERPNDERPHLSNLIEQARLVVTEDMPTDPAQAFLRAIRRKRKSIVLVDTACVAPMNLVGRAYERAFEYRRATKRIYDERVSMDWPGWERFAQNESRAYEDPVEFDLRIQDSSHLASLVAECEIDHLVAPVLDTRGGETAGYERWNHFVETGMKRYAKTRNNALLDGVSRMSAYLHYGMVSPMRLAHMAASSGGDGADKYLDELLIWRELAYCFCRFRSDRLGWRSIPNWAQETLGEHANDPREAILAWEQLSRGTTGDALWDAAQKSLLIHGELHNNVRMTWGKALLDWTKSPQDALQMIVDLNHRYALDGRDPASYGGILWCLGQFDRPFNPEQPVLGTVRPRPLSFHAQRLDPAKYSARVAVTRCPTPPRIAIVGAGLSGAIAARTLADHGLDVTVFEKSRGLGGRMARRRSMDGMEVSFDHGAQYFTARDPRFRRYVDSWVQQGICARWEGAIAVYDQPLSYHWASPGERFVGVPGMNAVAKHLLRDANVVTGALVENVSVENDKLLLRLADETGDRELGGFDRVIVSAPAPQSAGILKEFEELSKELSDLALDPCWATMIRVEPQLAFEDGEWIGAFINVGPLRWVARDSAKPGRPRDSKGEQLVLHAGSEWSREHLEKEPEWVAEEMIAALREVTGLECATQFARAHRWRYSIPVSASSRRCFASADELVLACGDWAGGPRVEGAFLSGCAAAGRVLGTLDRAAGSRVTTSQLGLF